MRVRANSCRGCFGGGSTSPEKRDTTTSGTVREAYELVRARGVVLDDVMGFQEPVTHHSDDVTEA